MSVNEQRASRRGLLIAAPALARGCGAQGKAAMRRGAFPLHTGGRVR